MRRTIVGSALVTACLTGFGCDILAGINRDYRLADGQGGSAGSAGTTSASGMTSAGGTTSQGGTTSSGGTTSMGGGGMGAGGMGGGGTGGTAGCGPGSMTSCYTGPDGTEGVGICKPGTATCTPEGMWGPCNGQVLPLPEQCSTPVDDDCDGTALDVDLGCVCLPGTSAPCYSGPGGTSGVGSCKDGSASCTADGKGYGLCDGEILPVADDCATPDDEDCDGSTPACPGGQIWAKGIGDSMSQVGKAVTAEPAGAVIVGGYVYGSADFGAGALFSAGGSDAFMARYDSAGALSWAKLYGDAGSQETRAVARDGAGGVAVTGVFSGTIDFKPGGTSMPLASAGSFDIFLAKIDMAGTTAWAKRFGNNTNQYGTDVAVASDGDVVLAGYFGGQVDFGGGLLTSNGGSDGCVARFDAAGNHKWGAKLGGTGSDYAYSVAAQANGTTVVAGGFNGSVDFGAGMVTSAGQVDAYLVTLDAGGIALWAKNFGGASDDVVNAMDVVPATGNIAIAGHFSGSINFGGDVLTSAGGTDAFVAVFGTGGNHLWSKRFGSVADDSARSVAYDAQGNLIVGGSFSGLSMIIDGTQIGYTGGNDIFLAKFDAASMLTWAASYGDGTNQVAYGVSADAAGNVLLTGSFEGALNFGGGVFGSNGAEDIFLVRLSP